MMQLIAYSGAFPLARMQCAPAKGGRGMFVHNTRACEEGNTLI